MGGSAAADCPARRDLLGPGGLADRVIVLANPSEGGRLLTMTLLLHDDAGASTTRQLTQAEALAVTAYDTLGWLEEDR